MCSPSVSSKDLDFIPSYSSERLIIEIQLERTKLDDNFDGARAILEVNGVAFKMAIEAA